MTISEWQNVGHATELSLPPGGAAKRKQNEENPRGNEELAFPWL